MRNLVLFIFLIAVTQTAFGQWYWGSKSGRSAAVNLTDRIASSKDITIGIGSDDPTTTPKNDTTGSLYLNSTAVYRKTDDGSSTNWDALASLPIDLASDVTGLLPGANMTPMVGASGVSNGTQGAVPQPLIADQLQFLRGDGGWETPTDTGVTTVGTIDSQTKSFDGLVISGSTIYAQNADATHPGLVSSLDQTIAGIKTFNSNPVFSALTAGRFTLTDTGGAQTNSSAFAWSGTAMTITGQLNVDSLRMDGDVISNQNSSGDVVIQADPGASGGRAKFTNGTSAEYYIGSNNPELSQMMTYPSFEESVIELQCLNCSGFSQVASTGVEGELYGLFHAQATYGGATTDEIWVMPGTNFDDDMNATVSCWINTARSGVTFRFSNTTDGDSDSQAVSSGSTWEKYSASGVCRSGIGEGCGWKIVDSTSEAGAININACTIKLGEVYGVSQIGTIDSVTKSANGATVSGSSLILQTADSNDVGLVSSSDQSFGGIKTFVNGIVDSTLTDGRVTLSGTSGRLVDDSGLLFNRGTDTLTVVGDVIVQALGGTDGDVTFVDTNGQLSTENGFNYAAGSNTLAVPNANITGRTSGRCAYYGTSGALSDDSGCTYNESSDQQSVGAVYATSTTFPSRMNSLTTAEKNAVSIPVEGNYVWDSTVNKQYNYNGTSWELVASTQDVVLTPNVSTALLVSALVSDGAGTTTVTQDSSNFIDGNCTNPGTGDYVCPFVSGFFSSAPHCWTMGYNSGNRFGSQNAAGSVSSVTLAFRAASDGTPQDSDFYLFCKTQ